MDANAAEAEALAALKAERENEARLYLAVRSDVDFGREGLVRLAAWATWEVLRAAHDNAPERFAAYDAAQQPKISVRLKNSGVAMKSRADAEAAGIPAFSAGVDGFEQAVVAVGPVARRDLPKTIRSLQMLGDEPAEGLPFVDTAALSPPDDATPAVWLAVREDAGIPYGKIAAQAGHGAWGALGPLLASKDPILDAWEAAGCPVGVLWLPDLGAMHSANSACEAAGINAAFIVDAGRTVYAGKPTPTLIGIGPCAARDLPEELAALAAFPSRGTTRTPA